MQPIVTDRVVWSVHLSVTLVSPAKMAELILMPFGLRTQVGPVNHVLDGGPDPHGKGQFCGGKGRPIVKYRDTLRSSIPPLPSNRHHLSCGDRLEGKGENYRVCSVQYCVQQLCTVRCTHI